MPICNIVQRLPLCCLPLNRLRLDCRLHEKMLSMLLVKQLIFEQEFKTFRAAFFAARPTLFAPMLPYTRSRVH